jgi:hypothetical protein
MVDVISVERKPFLPSLPQSPFPRWLPARALSEGRGEKGFGWHCQLIRADLVWRQQRDESGPASDQFLPLGSHSRACDLAPPLESLLHLLAVFRRGKAMSSWSEVLGNRTVRGEETLRMPWRFEPLHVPFSLARVLVRILLAVIGGRSSSQPACSGGSTREYPAHCHPDRRPAIGSAVRH